MEFSVKAEGCICNLANNLAIWGSQGAESPPRSRFHWDFNFFEISRLHWDLNISLRSLVFYIIVVDSYVAILNARALILTAANFIAFYFKPNDDIIIYFWVVCSEAKSSSFKCLRLQNLSEIARFHKVVNFWKKSDECNIKISDFNGSLQAYWGPVVLEMFVIAWGQIHQLLNVFCGSIWVVW